MTALYFAATLILSMSAVQPLPDSMEEPLEPYMVTVEEDIEPVPVAAIHTPLVTKTSKSLTAIPNLETETSIVQALKTSEPSTKRTVAASDKVLDSASSISGENARTKNRLETDACHGRHVLRRKNHQNDLAGYVAFLVGKLAGNDRTAVCMPLRAFIPPSFPTAAREAILLPPPPYASTPTLASPATIPAIIASAIIRPSLPIAKKAQVSTVRESEMTQQMRKQMYVVPLTISREKALELGVIPGIYPANYLENQKKGGVWSRRTRTVAQVALTADGKFLCAMLLERAPAKNSAVAVDFRNKKSIHVPSEMLQGITTHVVVPKLDKKMYADLKTAYSVKAPFLLSFLRIALPIVPQAAMGTATMGPPGAAMPVVGMIQGFAVRKLMGNQRAMAAVQNPSLHVNYVLADQDKKLTAQNEKLAVQNAKVTSLEIQIKYLMKEIEELRQNASATKIANKDGRKK